LLSRGGFAAEQKISVSHSDMTGEAIVELDPAKLIGRNTDPKAD
jgi:hypothetical protein